MNKLKRWSSIVQYLDADLVMTFPIFICRHQVYRVTCYGHVNTTTRPQEEKKSRRLYLSFVDEPTNFGGRFRGGRGTVDVD